VLRAADPPPLELLDEQSVKHPGTITGVAFTPDGTLLATSAHELKFWDVTAPEPKGLTAPKSSRVRSLAFSPDGKILAAGNWGESANLFNVSEEELTERATLEGHSFGAGCVAFNPLGKTVATGGDDGGVFIWDITKDKPKEAAVIKAGGSGVGVGVGAMAYTPNGKILAVATWNGGTLTFYDVSGKEPKAVGQMKEKHNLALAISPNGKILARGAEDKSVQLYSLQAAPKPLKALVGHAEPPAAITFSKDGSLLASCGKDGKVIVWDVTSGKQRFLKQRPQEFACLAIVDGAPKSGQFTLAAGNANTVYVYKIGPAQ
jgi:WD40 repeat protein